ncbi:DUF4339 domain-containing protein [Schlesneria paludicola]|uniref:DUF4339 domain-containing protein n=1 Tax=Schlesneria paludicola TaxID=360056 RepID=UPI00029AEAA8|nr:DUF4339 domain-containing protein [Schlesneria paludicola]
MHEIGPQKDVQADTSETTYWYILTESRQLGPIFFSRLQQMAHQGKVTHDDKVRRGTTGEWIRVGDMRSVLFPDASDPETPTAKAVPVRPPVDPRTIEPNFLARFFEWTIDRFSGLYDGIKLIAEDYVHGIRTIIGWTALVAVVCSLTIVLAKQLPVDWFTTTDPLLTYSSLWDELKQKRKANVPSSEWDTFATNAREKLTPIIARLEQTASTDNRIAQQLLWAGRDHLVKMLDDARDEKSPSEAKFAEHLQRAKWLREGKDLNGILRRTPVTLPWFLTDLTTILIAIPLFVVNLWIAGRLLFGRRDTGKSQTNPVLS